MTFQAALQRTSLLAIALVLSLSQGCKPKKPIEIDPAFAQYVSAFTSGTISATGKIRIRFTEEFKENITLETPLKEGWISFSPSIKGDLVWTDTQTLEFRPTEWLEQGQLYEVRFKLSEITSVPENLKDFQFSFAVFHQHMETEINSIQSYDQIDLTKMEMKGTIRTIDVCKSDELEKTLSAAQSFGPLAVRWDHSEDMRLHHFTVDSIRRTERADSVLVKWNGKAIGADQEGRYAQEIPALGDFKVIFTKVVQQPEQYIILQFSDPLDASQNLEGLVVLDQVYEERMVLDHNEIRIYPPYRLTGTHTVMVYRGVKNSMGFPSIQEQQVVVQFEDLKPLIQVPNDKRVILPSTDGMVFPFQAVNLSSVDVRIIRVFENNIPQFLQINEMGSDTEMKRVGRQVIKKTISLNADGSKDLAQWNWFYLNLDEIVQSEPGAIYRVELGFKREYSLYPCEGSSATETQIEEELATDWDEEESDASYWDYFDDYWYGEYYDEYYDYDYDWEERENPCSSSYYKYRRPVGKNILASDLGLIVKKGDDQSLECYVTNIKTALPMSDVSIDILNYQQQSLASGRTNNEGRFSVDKLDGTPFLLVAKKDRQAGYLKLDGGHSLAISSFDVGGSTSQKGLKGFIYGDRGVWRPGDTLFLAFMLEDDRKTLPGGHPIQFELKDPRGRVVQKMMRSVNDTKLFPLTCSTSSDAPTGTYTAQVRVGGATFTKPIRIETVKPNRLKLSLDFGKERITALDQKMSGVLSVKWLHGAVAKNLRTNVSATFSATTTRFDRFTDYTFDDAVKQFEAEEQVIFDGQVNAEGKATIPVEVNLQGKSPGMVNANFSIKVFEEGGDFSVDRFTIAYAPYDRFVGVRLPQGDKARGMLLTDTDHKAEIVTVDANGKPTAVKNLTWQVYKIAWRWWWEQSSDNLANYVGSESTVPIASGNISTSSDGKATFKFQVKYPDWGRYLVRVIDADGGHSTAQPVYIDWPGWAGRAQTENPGGASMLMFALDSDKYTVGDECALTIPSSGEGRLLVSIENGSRVIESHWVVPQKEQTRFTFKTTEEMTPNAYVHVTLIQPHAQSVNDMPLRMYGILPLFVENKDSHIEPVITMAKELAPEKAFDVKVCEKSGKSMSYTLAIVDEGLLDLTRFKTPDPWNHFYAREALGVNTFDMYDEVIGALGVKADRLLSIGGSDDLTKKGKNQVNRFKPVVIYEGPYTLKPGECKTHKLTMPNYIGAVRVMVVARKDEAYGNVEKSVPVKKPLMVLASLPRVLGPGESVQLPVTVFAMDKAVKEVQVSVEVNSLLQLSGSNECSVSFSQPGDQVINFPLTVKNVEGKATVKVSVSSGAFKSTYDVELEVRSPNPVQTTFIESVVDAGKDWSPVFDLTGIAGTNSAMLEVSTVPAVDFGRRLKYLLDYPHGCLEQTTSQAFPQLYLADVMDLGEKERKRAEDNIKAAINKLAPFQTASGGFTYWPGNTEEDQWATTYCGHFMLEAKKKGFSLPVGFESSWLAFQKKTAQNWRMPDGKDGNPYYQQGDLEQAYRLYTLALANQPEMGAMNRLKERPKLSYTARWRLAAAYALSGQKETARQLVKQIPSTVSEYTELGYTYGSKLRDEAMIIETLVLLEDRTTAASLIKELSARLSSDSWYSTQSTAFGLLAISRFAAKELGKEIRYTIALNSKTQPEKVSNKPIIQQTLDAKLKGNNLVLRNTTGNILYARIILSGKPAAGVEQVVSNGMTIDVSYQTVAGQAVNVSRIEQGTDFYALVSISHTGVRQRYDELALTEVFPSGWEIINSRLDPYAVASEQDLPEYQDIRDDRVLTYFDLYPTKTKTYRVKLNASYLGRYYLPGFHCEAMYDKSIQARNKGQWVEVVVPGNATAAVKQ